jgi:hypothetical protein
MEKRREERKGQFRHDRRRKCMRIRRKEWDKTRNFVRELKSRIVSFLFKVYLLVFFYLSLLCPPSQFFFFLIYTVCFLK